MKDYYENTRSTIDRYNQIANKIWTEIDETNENDDEFFQNFCIHLAHALIKDTGFDSLSREELCKAANIIIDVCE